jgi:dihydroorotate dehydrogenase electron transfer subunit
VTDAPDSLTCNANPLHAAYYADRAGQYRAPIVENLQLARDTWRMRLACPEIARRFVPGQFVMVRLAGLNNPLLGRPMALYDTVLDAAGQPEAIDIVYLVLGKMTRRLARYGPGDQIDIWGPLGNGFPPRPTEHLIMVAGGIGQTPFLALGQEYLGRRTYGDPPRQMPPAKRVTLCYGVRTAALAAGVDDFRAAGFEVRLSSDDGTLGHHGLVTEVLRKVLAETNQRAPNSRDAQFTRRGEHRRLVACCGPEPMMEAVAEICHDDAVSCLASLETPMACGIGICFSCVAKVRQPDGGWDYKRTCVEGPVFDAEQIVW